MKKIKNRLISGGIIVILVLVLVITSVFDSGKSALMKNVGFANYIYPQNEKNLTADFNTESPDFSLKALNGDKIWSVSVEETERLKLSDSRLWQEYMASLIVINYTDTRQNKYEVKKLYSASKGNKVTATETDNGINYAINFSSVNISVNVELEFNGSVLTLRIPADKITEGERYLLTAIEILPFFGAADHTVDGYIFYPDGSGALMCYEDYANHSQVSQAYTMQVYGSPEFEDKEQMSGSCMLPVYGIKNGSNAFLAAITSGAADCNVNISAEGNVVALNRASFTMNYRYTYTVPGSDIIATAMDTDSTYADKNMTRQDFECAYFFLSGENASYSGMANAYRDFLIENKLLGQQKTDSEISIEFVTGVTENQMLFDKSIAATTFEDVIKYTEELNKSGLSNLDIILSGWEKGGIGVNSKGYKPWNILGGSSKLKKLCKKTEELGIKLILSKNILSVTNEDKGYSLRNDIIYTGNQMVLTDDFKNHFVLNDKESSNRLKAVLKGKNQTVGLMLEDFGCYISSDYSEKGALSRSQTAEEKTKLLKTNENEYISIEGGNFYALASADKLTGIPSESSGLFIADKDVPFYQMLVHGSVCYTGNAYNLSYDSDKQFLKMLEYGYQPYFILTTVESEKLKYTACNELFSCEFDKWKDNVIKVSGKMKNLSCVKEQKIIEHYSDENISKVTYENGCKLLINYSDKNTEIDGFTVKAKDYVILDEKGAVK